MAERARRPLRAMRPQAFRFGSLPPSPLRPSTLPMPSRRGRLRPRRLPDLRHHRARRVAGEGSQLDGGPRGCRRPLPRPCHEVLSVSQRRLPRARRPRGQAAATAAAWRRSPAPAAPRRSSTAGRQLTDTEACCVLGRKPAPPSRAQSHPRWGESASRFGCPKPARLGRDWPPPPR